MQVGFIMATLGMIALTFLNQDSSYMQEALTMFFMGLGMGVAMPTLNLAVQNEFEQAQLGAATSSNQLFRSLGSTLGTAIFGAVLTAGILSHIGNIQSTPYVQAISASPQVSKLGDINDSNTILTLNMPSVKKEITDGATKSIQATAAPATVKHAAQTTFIDNQKSFSSIVTHAFSESLQRIFIVAAVLMTISTVLIFMLKERPLKSAKSSDTPMEM